ncbi:hypothetical protein U5801_24395 [Lamprobacter modestohalophilus]|uniref:beta strand repeat-containing protein n=1 Tax=Lamprobacter modestohalophilus TaxID=1064514 RepID=UPI002ADEB896|nr:hypothetical protein [Lamprobacter modestohalophilus]MEA1052923.1 hypothetical protein [Lamprobacter modestohalophilus]
MTDGIGLFNNATARFNLKDAPSSGAADNSFLYGPADSGWAPLAGDWSGDGTDTIALYNSTAGRFYQRNENSNGTADDTFIYGPSNSTWTPIVGDWDGDGDDTIGLYDASTGRFFLRNENTGGIADEVFQYGAIDAGWTPIVGDWDGDGVDTIGMYNAAAGRFYLRNDNSNGVADIVFNYGAIDAGWIPVAGDWNDDGTDTIGLFDPAAGLFKLRNTNDNGIADINARFGPTDTDWIPLVGNWAGTPVAPTYTLTDALPLYQEGTLEAPYNIDPESTLAAGTVNGADAAATLTDVEAIIAGADNSGSVVLANVFTWSIEDTAANLFEGEAVKVDLTDALTGATAVTVTSAVTLEQQTALNAINDNVTYEGGLVGDSFVLTTGVDIFTGTENADTFEGVSSSLNSDNTLNADDQLDGAGGTDTLEIAMSGNFGGFSEEGFAKNIENINLTNSGSNARTFNATGVEGALQYNLTGLVNLSKLAGTGAAVNLNEIASETVTIGYADGAVSGTSDIQVLGLNGVGTANTADTDEASATVTVGGVVSGVEELQVTAEGTNVVALGSDAASAIAVDGEGALKLTDVGTGLKTFDGSAATGSLDVNLSEATGVTSVKGGSAADVFRAKGDDLTVNAVVNGGAGEGDVLELTGNAIGTVQYQMSDVETLWLSGVTSTFSAANTSGLEKVRVAHTGNDAVIANLGGIALDVDLYENTTTTGGGVSFDHTGATTLTVTGGTKDAETKAEASTTLTNSTSVEMNVSEYSKFEGKLVAGKAQSLSVDASADTTFATDSNLSKVQSLTVAATDSTVDTSNAAMGALTSATLSGDGAVTLGDLGTISLASGIEITASGLNDNLTLGSIKTADGEDITVDASTVLGTVMMGPIGAAGAGTVELNFDGTAGDILINGGETAASDADTGTAIEATTVSIDASGALGTVEIATSVNTDEANTRSNAIVAEKVTFVGSELKSNIVGVNVESQATLTGGIAQDTFVLNTSAGDGETATITVTGGIGNDSFLIASDAGIAASSAPAFALVQTFVGTSGQGPEVSATTGPVGKTKVTITDFNTGDVTNDVAALAVQSFAAGEIATDEEKETAADFLVSAGITGATAGNVTIVQAEVADIPVGGSTATAAVDAILYNGNTYFAIENTAVTSGSPYNPAGDGTFDNGETLLTLTGVSFDADAIQGFFAANPGGV